ncbi:MAG: molybdopterin molybdenumtransferase MoeA [Anaerolineales bacterium]|nr:molybdopterin molybdenumtransferase MoeA [Anaerolineales bacterium]MCB8953970.1 molybdopterin molybdenumtransferase MoeA [Ardenticatenales bacterium]
MSEFLHLIPPPEALARLLAATPISPRWEMIPAGAALGRVAAADVLAPFSLPSFPRSTVDGYAVRAAETHGASESLPAYLRLTGEVLMGSTPTEALEPGACVLIHTGGMLPEGADAVVMVEQTQSPRNDEVEIWRAVAHGENVIRVGEDVAAGAVVVAAGTRIRAAELGGLMALGIGEMPASRPPRVGILSSGDEVVAPGTPLQPGQVYDVNTYTLSALVMQAGGQPVPYGIIPDRPDAFHATARRARDECDVVVFTAGSSVSARDLTARTIAELGPPGVLVHGVNVRPGKPTILAVCGGKAVIGLPGNPVSALVIGRLFLTPLIAAHLGLQQTRPGPSVPAFLGLNLASQTGREDWVAVRLEETDAGFVAQPIFGKSNLIFTLARADGLICIPADANGIDAGTPVTVIPL